MCVSCVQWSGCEPCATLWPAEAGGELWGQRPATEHGPRRGGGGAALGLSRPVLELLLQTVINLVCLLMELPFLIFLEKQE